MATLQNLSDDQIAILGCCVALAMSFGLMMVSYHVGRFVRGERTPEPIDAAASAAHRTVEPQNHRQAA